MRPMGRVVAHSQKPRQFSCAVCNGHAIKTGKKGRFRSWLESLIHPHREPYDLTDCAQHGFRLSKVVCRRRR